MELQLQKTAIKSSAFNSQRQLSPNGACLHLNTLCIVLIESNWGFLSIDDQIQEMRANSVDINLSV